MAPPKLTPEFTEEFNVAEPVTTTSDWAAYRKFIEKLRKRLGETKSHALPVLTPQKDVDSARPLPSTHWFDLVLKTKTHSIKLKIRRDNLYLDAYQMHKSDQWWEFGSEQRKPPQRHLINGSIFLGFGGSYQELANNAKKEIKLGKKSLEHAVDNLAVAPATDNASRAESLIVVLHMICESIRFARISNYFSETYKGEGEKPATWMTKLEHAWEDLSKALLQADANPDKFFKVSKEIEKDLNIKSHHDAVALLGILIKKA
ncbi:hypothetical protein J5N97_022608 [Dioscorea zingiberensis]|uniref:rRNA N-glycosylase n=1 Tax=Dioscorea zingiberensis TaxID=325984 RepID=A0A9D5CAW8_9LILI|nr:hypothetical protein J5N97_022608 [Dioscorea zingiberensis]